MGCAVIPAERFERTLGSEGDFHCGGDVSRVLGYGVTSICPADADCFC
jgi:hypothetical protein